MNSGASLENAAVLAMRDAAALMIMKMDQETGISSLTAAPVKNEVAEISLPEEGSNFAAGGQL